MKETINLPIKEITTKEVNDCLQKNGFEIKSDLTIKRINEMSKNPIVRVFLSQLVYSERVNNMRKKNVSEN